MINIITFTLCFSEEVEKKQTCAPVSTNRPGTYLRFDSRKLQLNPAPHKHNVACQSPCERDDPAARAGMYIHLKCICAKWKQQNKIKKHTTPHRCIERKHMCTHALARWLITETNKITVNVFKQENKKRSITIHTHLDYPHTQNNHCESIRGRKKNTHAPSRMISSAENWGKCRTSAMRSFVTSFESAASSPASSYCGSCRKMKKH